MHAGVGEVCATGDHPLTIDDHKLVVHEAAAFAAVFGVINPGNTCFLKNEQRIAIPFFPWA